MKVYFFIYGSKEINLRILAHLSVSNGTVD